MKTLKEQVEEIKAGKGSKAIKKDALIKLGLRPYEISLIMSELPKKVRESVLLTFGVEIECLVPRTSMIECAERNIRGLPFYDNRYNVVNM